MAVLNATFFFIIGVLNYPQRLCDGDLITIHSHSSHRLHPQMDCLSVLNVDVIAMALSLVVVDRYLQTVLWTLDGIALQKK